VVTDTPTGQTSGAAASSRILGRGHSGGDLRQLGLVRATFTSGILLSQDQGTFSQSSLFLAFTIDKTWKLPGYYSPRGLKWPPGVNSFFETRLTSIPVTSCTTTAAGTSGGGSGGTSSECATTGSTTPLDTFLASRKTTRLAVGAYLPLTMRRWTYRGTPNSLFLAPIAKLGFDTPAGALNQTQPSGTTVTGGTVTALNPTNFYTFYDFGGRFGHYAMTNSRDDAPETSAI
jgi:hypothetical protein